MEHNCSLKATLKSTSEINTAINSLTYRLVKAARESTHCTKPVNKPNYTYKEIQKIIFSFVRKKEKSEDNGKKRDPQV